VKSVFTDKTDQGKEDAEEEPKAKSKNHIGMALGSAEYLQLLQFFTGELPKILV
jgi:hypothetical protein